MTDSETNKKAVRDFIDRVFVQLDPNAVDELVAHDFQSHSWPAQGIDGKSALRAATGRVGKSLDQISFTINDLIAEDDRVAARLTARARQIGEFMGLPPSNRSYEIGEIHIFRLRDAKIVEHWLELDAMGLLKQLKP